MLPEAYLQHSTLLDSSFGTGVSECTLRERVVVGFLDKPTERFGDGVLAPRLVAEFDGMFDHLGGRLHVFLQKVP